MKTVNILFCGTGGQGILTASEIVGRAAMFDGFHAKKSEVHGMAQRGGSVESHLRFGKEVFSPIIEKAQADFLVPFHKGEHDRMSDMLKKDGVDLLNEFLQADKDLSDKKYINTYMLGVLSRHLDLTEESWLKAMTEVFKGKNTEKNFEIFRAARANNH